MVFLLHHILTSNYLSLCMCWPKKSYKCLDLSKRMATLPETQNPTNAWIYQREWPPYLKRRILQMSGFMNENGHPTWNAESYKCLDLPKRTATLPETQNATNVWNYEREWPLYLKRRASSLEERAGPTSHHAYIEEPSRRITRYKKKMDVSIPGRYWVGLSGECLLSRLAAGGGTWGACTASLAQAAVGLQYDSCSIVLKGWHLGRMCSITRTGSCRPTVWFMQHCTEQFLPASMGNQYDTIRQASQYGQPVWHHKATKKGRTHVIGFVEQMPVHLCYLKQWHHTKTETETIAARQQRNPCVLLYM